MKTNADFTLRSVLAQAEAQGPERVWRIKERVNLDHDVTAVAMELERDGRSPILWFENVGDYPFPVIANLFGNRASYEYNELDVRKIVVAIETAVETVKAKMNATGKKSLFRL